MRFRNGDLLSGRIRAFDGDGFMLDVPFAGQHRINVKDICTISNRRRMPPKEAAEDNGPGRSLLPYRAVRRFSLQ